MANNNNNTRRISSLKSQNTTLLSNATKDNDNNFLYSMRQIALLHLGGFQHNLNRQIVWPKLLGVSLAPNDQQSSNSWVINDFKPYIEEYQKNKKEEDYYYCEINKNEVVKNVYHHHYCSSILNEETISQIVKDVMRSGCFFNSNNIFSPPYRQLNLLAILLEKIFQRHNQNLVYTQGVHEVTSMFLKIFEKDILDIQQQQNILKKPGPIENSCYEENLFSLKEQQQNNIFNHENNQVLSNTTTTMWYYPSLLYRSSSLLNQEEEIPKSFILYNTHQQHIVTEIGLCVEQMCLFHLTDLLIAPLDIAMLGRLTAIGTILWVVDRPLYSLLTAVSQWTRLTTQSNNDLQEYCYINKKKKIHDYSCCCSGLSECRGILCSSDYWDLQHLTGHEFQFCLTWILTLFTHDLLPISPYKPQCEELCARLWDAILSAPPTYILYVCVALIRCARKELFHLAHKYGCFEYLESKNDASSSSSCKNHCPNHNERLPPTIINRKKIESYMEDILYGLKIDPTLFDPYEFDFLQVDIFAFFQQFFRSQDHISQTLIEHVITDASNLMLLCNNNNSKDYDDVSSISLRFHQRKYSLPCLKHKKKKIDRLCPNCLLSSFPIGQTCCGIPPFSALYHSYSSLYNLGRYGYKLSYMTVDKSKIILDQYVLNCKKIFMAKQCHRFQYVPINNTNIKTTESESSVFWDLQAKLFTSLLSNRLIYRLVQEWYTITRRLLLASRLLIITTEDNNHYNNKNNSKTTLSPINNIDDDHQSMPLLTNNKKKLISYLYSTIKHFCFSFSLMLLGLFGFIVSWMVYYQHHKTKHSPQL